MRIITYPFSEKKYEHGLFIHECAALSPFKIHTMTCSVIDAENIKEIVHRRVHHQRLI